VVLSSACGEQATSPRIEPRDAILAARAPALSTVSLIVTVANTDSLGKAYGIQNDGVGAYTDGNQNVSAVLDQYGTFAFNTLAKGRTATRWVTYNFNNPVDPANSYRPNPSNLENNHFSTGASNFQPFIPIQNLGVNGNPVSECIYMGNSVANSTTQWRVSYHKGLEDLANSPTAYAVVTRQSVSPAVWTITPSGACSPISNVASLRSGDSSILYGYYRIPFLFTLRAK
jgi:hypothetical protein